jgi:hypothetical protein
MSQLAGPSRGTVSSQATTAQPHQRPSSWSCDAARARADMPRWLFLSFCSGEAASASNVDEKTASPSLSTGFLFVATKTFVRRYFLTGISGGGSGFSSRQVYEPWSASTGSASSEGGFWSSTNFGNSSMDELREQQPSSSVRGPLSAFWASTNDEGGGGAWTTCGVVEMPTTLSPTTLWPAARSRPASSKPPIIAVSLTLLTMSAGLVRVLRGSLATSSAFGTRTTTSNVVPRRSTGLDERHAPSPKALSLFPTGFEGDRSRRGRAWPPPTRGARGGPVIVSDASDAARKSCVRLGAFGGWTAAALAPPGRRGVGSGTAAFGFGTLGCGSCIRTAMACRIDP